LITKLEEDTEEKIALSATAGEAAVSNRVKQAAVSYEPDVCASAEASCDPAWIVAWLPEPSNHPIDILALAEVVPSAVLPAFQRITHLGVAFNE
jgi:hypothetical protein